MHDEITNRLTKNPKRMSEISFEPWSEVWKHKGINNDKLDEVLSTFHRKIPEDIAFSFSVRMIEQAILRSKDPSPGPDNIPFVVYRRCVDQVAPIIFEIIADTMEGTDHVIPESFYLSKLFLFRCHFGSGFSLG